MVTFSIPGDSEFAESGRSTPRPRPPLPFAKRAYVSSPFNSKRLGTPQSAPARRLLMTRDEIPSSSLNKTSIATARNIFRASTISDSPPATSFSPSLPQSTMKKVFAPGATPEPNRMFRESTAQVTPRGMAAKATSKQLFPMRIEDPDPELSGEALTKKIPKEWNTKGSIYADQFLAHLCPPDFDEEQKRQFFCILDLRRLKYAANEIFIKKDWKLNVINFAKEFEKSRSIILLRYGLYEFQNVKPSKDVLKRWRREHGLPEPEEENTEPTPTKVTASKKRKADDDLPKDNGVSAVNKNKRRAADKDDEDQTQEAPTATPSLNKNKRKASVSGETESQPSKMQKSTPSAAKSLLEKITNNSATPAGSPMKAVTKPAEEGSAAKPNPFALNKANGGSALRSVFENLKPSPAQAGGSNIFEHLSDASSAKNSGVEADAESETDSDAEQSDEPSAIASGAETASQIGSALFGAKHVPTSAPVADESSAPGTRESTPGRSLFDRVTKNSDGQPVRADGKLEETTAEPAVAKPAPKPVDQTWNPSTTPIKFAPATTAAQPSSLFGNASTSSSSVFAPKTTVPTNIFGSTKQDKPAEKESSSEVVAEQKDKSGGESDKENDQAPKKPTSLFQPKGQAETLKLTEPAKPTPSLFGALKSDDKPAGPSTPNIFGKPAESSTPAAPVLQSSTLFGAKLPETAKSSDAPKTTSLFGSPAAASTNTDTPTASSLFGVKPPSTTSNIFGGASLTPPTTSLFGGSSSGNVSTPRTDSAPVTTAFSFGAASTGGVKSNGTSDPAPKSLFGVPESPSASAPPFGGSPMKQDGPSPVKRAFNGGEGGMASAAPIFNFGNLPSTPAVSSFGGASLTPAAGVDNASTSFGASSSNSGSSFSFGTAGTSFNNPFTSGSNGDNTGFGTTTAPAPGAVFNFGGNAAPSASAPSTFQFGGGGTSAPAPVFGGSQASNATSLFGGASGAGAGGAPGFNFTAASPQPPATGGMFGSTQPTPAFGNLQPPAGGASTTGTNTPLSLGGGSSLATTPAGGTPEPSASTKAAPGGDEDEGEKHEQINLTEGLEADEETLHDVRAKVLKFVAAGETSDDKPKSKSPWSTQGVGPLRLLKHKETNALRLLMRAEPRGNVALNRAVLADMTYTAEQKYVKLTTSNETGDGLETWMVQVKTKDLAKELAEVLEKHKSLNKK
ncbi:hypothetical protein AK830_g10604 [Neonectria ditissima]|uniref:RanBD1 domain-containing protein n=1 Tax=Neonectria ditissima TaxID=78410 RepID=A0A0N8H5E8_9HYPO|nr:hypothetical protein AK830_g10604 [Neonectria ditissima]